MLYTSIAVVLALASSAASQTFFDAIQTPAKDQVLPAGVPFDLIWNPAGVSGTATLQLIEGATNVTLQPGPIIAQSIDNLLGKFSWTPEDRGHATYGWQITLDSDKTKQQLSNYFHISGSGSSSASGSSTTTVQLSTGPSYTASSTVTSTIPSSTLTVVTTSTSGSSSATSLPGTGNSTSTSLVLVTSQPSTTSSSKSSSTSSTTSETATTNSGNVVARGGFAAVGGLLLALAL